MSPEEAENFYEDDEDPAEIFRTFDSGIKEKTAQPGRLLPRKREGGTMSARYGENIANDMLDELGQAMSKFGPMASAHEGYAVLLEELDELWEEIKLKDRDKARMRAEAIQVGAMAIRFIKDLELE